MGAATPNHIKTDPEGLHTTAQCCDGQKESYMHAQAVFPHLPTHTRLTSLRPYILEYKNVDSQNDSNTVVVVRQGHVCANGGGGGAGRIPYPTKFDAVLKTFNHLLLGSASGEVALLHSTPVNAANLAPMPRPQIGTLHAQMPCKCRNSFIQPQ